MRRGSSFVRRLALFILPAAMLICLPAADAGAMTREDVLAVASRYARHAWTCSSGNSHRLYNDLRSGKRYRGVSYNMGGFDSLDDFERKTRRGTIAGNSKRRCGRGLCIRRNLAGLDCSGFMSRCFGIPRHTTRSLPQISAVVRRVDLEPGDILNAEGYHAMLFDRFDDEGQVWVYESVVRLRRGGSPPAGVAHRAVDWDRRYTARRLYHFIHKGERVSTVRSTAVRVEPGGRLKKSVSARSSGMIIDGPRFSGAGGTGSVPREVWFKIDYDDGTQGWSPVRYLVLTGGGE